MKKAIVIAFTLKGQPFEKIAPRIEEIAKANANQEIVLIHGHMPRELVVEKGFSTDMLDTFDKFFPEQINFFKDGTLRDLMADVAKLVNAEIWIIGEIKEGVVEEVKAYTDRGLNINLLAI